MAHGFLEEPIDAEGIDDFGFAVDAPLRVLH